jgi:glycosyltransferase involved in cell wall biosynthesis
MKTDVDDDVLGFTTDWINALAIHFERVFVITMCKGKLGVASNVEVFSVGKERGYSEPRRALEFYRLLFSVLRRHRIDVCFTHMIAMFAVMAWPVLRPRRIPIVLWYGHKATPFMMRLAHRLVDRVVTSVPAGFRLASNKVVVVGQGITESKFSLRPRAPKGNPFTIISVARLSRIKNIDVMIEALALVLRNRGAGAARLMLIGDAITTDDRVYKDELLRLVERHNLGDAVTFVGSVPHHQVQEWCSRADLSLNLAPFGAVDKAALEGLASGVPVIVHNASFGPLFESVGADSTRYMVLDLSPAALANAIEEWMAGDEQKSREMCETLSRHVLLHHGITQSSGRIAAQLKEVAQR